MYQSTDLFGFVRGVQQKLRRDCESRTEQNLHFISMAVVRPIGELLPRYDLRTDMPVNLVAREHNQI